MGRSATYRSIKAKLGQEKPVGSMPSQCWLNGGPIFAQCLIKVASILDQCWLNVGPMLAQFGVDNK